MSAVRQRGKKAARAEQLVLFKKRGGKRRGAGRPPKGKRAGAPHKQRPYLDARYPVHVVLRVVAAIGNLRRRGIWGAVREATLTTARREDFRIIQVSLQRNHVHLLVEADDKEALASGMQGFQISAAAYADDLDAAVLLRFPGELVAQYGLAVGARLLAVNTFIEQRGARTGAMMYAVDLVPGPKRSGWSNFTPFIAEFFSDDMARIEERKRQIDEPEWRTVAACAETRIAKLGLDTARSGKPTQAGIPIRREGTRYFQTIEGSPETKSWWKRLLDS